jgi:type II secretory ATPase GspE/PulE/Tfp pilus assembly ATPase PilB-like protein
MAVKKPSEQERRAFEATAAARPGTGEASRLGNILEEAGYVSHEMIASMIPEDESAQSLKQTLVSQGIVSENDILDAVAANEGYERVSLRDMKVDPELVKLIDARHATKYKVFPVRMEGDDLYMAISDPLNIQITDDLERIYHKRIHPVVADEHEIEKFIAHYYEGNNIADIYGTMADEAVAKESASDEEDQYSRVDLTTKEKKELPPAVKYVDMMFKTAVNDRASDIHVEPTKTTVAIRFRVDGVLHEYPSVPKKLQNSIISRLKVLSGMDLAEKRVPLDGRIKLDIPGKKLDVRVSSIPSVFGESIVMRLLDQSNVLMGLEDVGFLPDSIRMFEDLIRSPNGVILMTGPTGSGKTTTLYSALSTINNSETKIVTIEDPVEYMLDGINQVQINRDVGLDFAVGLRSILRQSPDVIMVGEMRDLEAAEIGIRAALTGHLVFSTLHTNDAPSACVRLIDMGVKPFMVASSLQAVIAQRLVRRICGNCKEAYKPKPAEIANAGFDPDDYADVNFYKGRGCDRCGKSGYRGRTAIHEIFVNNPEIRQLIMRVESASKLKKVGIKHGMRTLRMDGWEKAQLGQTTIEEVLRITVDD